MNCGTKKVSIIIPVYNNASALRISLESLKPPPSIDLIEIIVVDGGSTDGIESLLDEYSDMITFISEPDQGVYDAINKGIIHAQGNWIYVLGSGDVVLPSFYDAIKVFNNELQIYYGNIVRSSTAKIYAGAFCKIKLFHKNIPHQAIFIPKSVIMASPYELRYPIMADYAKNLELFPKYDFTYIPFSIARYEDEKGLSATQKDEVFIKDKKYIIRNNYERKYYALYCIYDVIMNTFRLRIVFWKLVAIRNSVIRHLGQEKK